LSRQKKYGQRLLPLMVLSVLSIWRHVPGKNIKEVSCESFQLCGLYYPPPEGGKLTDRLADWLQIYVPL